MEFNRAGYVLIDLSDDIEDFEYVDELYLYSEEEVIDTAQERLDDLNKVSRVLKTLDEAKDILLSTFDIKVIGISNLQK